MQYKEPIVRDISGMYQIALVSGEMCYTRDETVLGLLIKNNMVDDYIREMGIRHSEPDD